jgi:hypothetical protein
MKATELRVNNWYMSVKFNIPGRCELTDFTQLDYMSDGAYDDPPIDEVFEPIPLTEEWLLKFGFCIYYDSYVRHSGRKTIEISLDAQADESGDVWIGYSNDIGIDIQTISLCEIKYVHQLQNLYFALTGEELTIKDV